MWWVETIARSVRGERRTARVATVAREEEEEEIVGL